MSLGYYRALMNQGDALDDLLNLGVNWKFVGDPNADGGVTLSGSGNVDAFNDLSGNSAHFSTSTTTEVDKPTIGGDGQIQVIGANSYLDSDKATSYWDFLTRPQTFSQIVFARIKDNNVGSANVHDWWSAGASLGNDVSWHQQKISSDRFRQLMYYPAGGTFYESATNLFTQTGFWNFGTYLDSSIHSGGGVKSSLFVYEDNVEVANLSATVRSDANLNTAQSLRIGTDSNTASSFTSDIEILKLAIAEGDIDEDDRDVIEAWLNS